MKLYNTNPNLKDTDGDGIDDFTECMIFNSNPNSAEGQSITAVQQIPASNVSKVVGKWAKSGAELYSSQRRGQVEYTLAISTADTYILEIEGRENSGKSGVDLPIKVWVDGQYVAKNILNAAGTEYAKVSFLLPHLSTGNHTVRVLFDNGHYDRALRLKSLTLLSIDGSDSDSNGMKDWIENRLTTMCSVEIVTSTNTNQETATESPVLASKVSPACVEGKAVYLDMMSITDGLTIQRGAGHRWFTSVALEAEISKDIEVSFQNGAKTINKSIHWATTNILTEEALVIRKGDSLLFTAEYAAERVTANCTVNGQLVNITPDANQPYLFAESGMYSVVSSHTAADGSIIDNTLTVTVVDYALPADDQMCLVDAQRSLTLDKVPDTIEIQGDARLEIFAESDTSTAESTVYTLVNQINEARGVVACLKDTGLIISKNTLQGVNI